MLDGTRAPYLEDLFNSLQNSNTLMNHGLPGIPVITPKDIMVFADWDEDKKARQYGCKVIIEPLDSEPDQTPNEACKTKFNHRFNVMAQVKNARATQQHFQACEDNGVYSFKGAFVDAANLEKLIREAMIEANDQLFAFGQRKLYEKFRLVRLPDTIQSNGWLVMTQLYETSYIF